MVSPDIQRALTLHRSGNIAGAVDLYRRLLAKNPNDHQALHYLGVALATLGKNDEAEKLIQRSLLAKPVNPEFFANYAHLLFTMGRHVEALGAFNQLLALMPTHVTALNTRGVILAKLQRFAEAVSSFDTALQLNPSFVEAHYNRGRALQEQGRFEETIASYDRAIALHPNYVDAHAGRGFVLALLTRYREAIAAYDRGIGVDSRRAELWLGRANVLLEMGRYEEAISDYERALALKPDLDQVPGRRIFAKMHLSDWRGFDSDCEKLVSDVRRGRLVSSPGPLVAVPSTPSDQLACARTFSASYHRGGAPLWRGERYNHDRVRIAYVADTFRDHATSYLMAGVFESHDRARFRTVAISLAPELTSATLDRVRAAFDDFVTVERWRDEDVAKFMRESEVDIAVDLMGYTGRMRTSIFALRPCPIQVNFLGFPGTMGANFIDYLIADKVVIPENQRSHYSESIVYLPHSYQPNDRGRIISDRSFTRSDCGLPEHGFVLCCFNSNYKITPRLFDVWMRLLRAVDGSVLWLLAGAPGSADNLRREAEQRQVSGSRLVFAPHLPLEEHLARHRLADLFLDTTICNAHTTASDALWAGLPVLTCAGETFASRVAASLLTAVGAPELITSSLDEYEALALKLAADPSTLERLRARLWSNRMTHPLFDTQRFTRDLETAYLKMWERYQCGAPPETFAIEPQ
jgi:protein O-GlcNAc transferase